MHKVVKFLHEEFPRFLELAHEVVVRLVLCCLLDVVHLDLVTSLNLGELRTE